MHYRPPRFAAHLNLEVEHGSEIHQAQLVSISSKGARISKPDGLPPDAQVMLRYLHLRVPARAVWSLGRMTGLEFPTHLSGPNLYMLRKGCGEGS
jgi:hypothetical protein